MIRCLHKILRAAFVLPFTAGLIKDRRNGSYAVHDGSISGVVLLTTIVIIVVVTSIALPIENSRYLMIGLLFLATFSLIFCSVLVYYRSHWKYPRKPRVTDKLKIIFLWGFCIGNIVYLATKLAVNIQCDQYPSLVEPILYYIFIWVFDISQTAFIHYFSRFRFASMTYFYYILMFMFVANISAWTHRTIDMYYDDQMLTILEKNQTDNTCNNKTTAYQTVAILKPFLEPLLLEYCLLCMIFISEMWPKYITETKDQADLHAYDSASHQQSCENQPLLSSRPLTLSTSHHSTNKKSLCCVVFGILYTLSYSIMQCVFLYVDELKPYHLINSIYSLFGNFVTILMIIKCFYELSGQLQPKKTPRTTMNMKHFIILTTSLATCGFFLFQLIGAKYHNTRDNVNVVIRLTATILQTTFILQMKQYRKCGNMNSYFSIRNVFSFVCIINFGMWFYYTFVSAQHEFFQRYRHPMFDRHTSLAVKHFWFPFLIFYHFECFLTFYRFFKE
ncbi:uncharacterized protein LOC127707487 [Mytilus californianus]|uniref:uncharacterized protein LOC127707487 n=1 Tax=Mytilus californianus TaxID=6549 RepID=UPI002245614E|nr:uncharacterized protein LOC127707487 [Mytilus californianus]